MSLVDYLQGNVTFEQFYTDQGYDVEKPFTKNEVNYSEGKADRRCKNCVFYLDEAEACRIVKGDIDPEFWCEKFIPEDIL